MGQPVKPIKAYISLHEKEETVVLRGKNSEAQKVMCNGFVCISFNLSFFWDRQVSP